MDTISVSQLAQGVPNPIFIYSEHHSGFRAPHRHDFIEIGFVMEGTGRQITLAGEQEVQPGDIFIITPAAWHGLSDANRLGMEFCCLSPSVLHAELSELMQDARMKYLLHTGPRESRGILALHLSPEELQQCLSYVRAIRTASGGACTDGNASLLSHPNPIMAFWRQLAHLVLLLTYLGELCEQNAHILPQIPSSVIQEVVVQIEAAPYRDWTLNELAAVACLEPSYFIRRFRKEVGTSPLRYLFQVRMQQASELLVNTNKPINEIAEEAGFEHPSHFSARFREYFRTTPARYRLLFKGGLTADK